MKVLLRCRGEKPGRVCRAAAAVSRMQRFTVAGRRRGPSAGCSPSAGASPASDHPADGGRLLLEAERSISSNHNAPINRMSTKTTHCGESGVFAARNRGTFQGDRSGLRHCARAQKRRGDKSYAAGHRAKQRRRERWMAEAGAW